jgi:hypothetical protein
MGKAKQLDLHNKPVSPVTVKKTPVSYVKEDYESEKFTCSMRDDARDAAEEEGDIESLIRQKLRPKKGEKIAKGETDDAVNDLLEKLEGE